VPLTSAILKLPPLRRRAHERGLSWQAEKQNSACKASLILPELERLHCRSVLDIGCNAGQVARELSKDRFVVGIDQKLDLRGFMEPLSGVALGEFPFTLGSAKCIPSFDAVLLLSVHHQWYASRSKSEADRMFAEIVSIARLVVFVEFAALTAKFGRLERFIDNDAASVQSFAQTYLERFAPSEKIRLLGACPESRHEPERFMFMLEK
jgi:SAM-dependent methyltransferase